MINRSYHILSILLIVIFALSACTGGQSAVVKEPLNVAWTVWAGEFPHLIAQEKGFFQKRGLIVNLTLYDAQSPELADLQSGKIDGGIFSLTDTMGNIARNLDGLRIILGADTTVGADAIVAVPEVANVSELRGKRIAVNLGSQTEFFARYALKTNGVSVGDVTFVDMDPESVPNALGSQVDAGHTWDPYLSEAVAKGNHIIYSTKDAPGLLADVLVFRKEIVDARPEDMHAYVDAWFEALDYWQKNPAESAAIIAKYTGLTPEEVSTEGLKLLTLADNQKAFAPGNDTSSLYYTAQLNLDFLITIGAVNRNFDVQQVFVPEFIQ